MTTENSSEFASFDSEKKNDFDWKTKIVIKSALVVYIGQPGNFLFLTYKSILGLY